MNNSPWISQLIPFGAYRFAWGWMGCVTLVLGIATSPAFGQLACEENEIVVELAEGQDSVEARFQLLNSGGYPLTIVSIEDDSREATVELATGSVTVRPGERRDIDLKWTKPGRFFHPSYVEVDIQTDERDAEALGLRLEVRPHGWTRMMEEHEALQQRLKKIPAPIVIQPERLEWTVGSNPVSQTVEIQASGVSLEQGLSLVESQLAGRNVEFDTTLEVVVEGKKYRLVVTPKSTARPLMARWGFDTHLEGDTALAWPSRRLSVIAAVRPRPDEKDLDQSDVSAETTVDSEVSP